MSVQLGWTTVMKMPPAITPLVALSVPAMLALMEMESTAQVRLAIFSLFSWLKSSYSYQSTFVCYLLCEYSKVFCFCCCSGVSQLKTTIDSLNRHQWVWIREKQLPYIFKLFRHNWKLWMYLQKWIWRRWSQLYKYVWAENVMTFMLYIVLAQILLSKFATFI